MKDKYVQASNRGDKTRAHNLIAERVLGRRLPRGAQVHHVDNDGRNNHHDNLVICPDASYHRLLHTRQAALDACGDANWRKCGICSEYGDPQEMGLYKISKKPNNQPRAFHKACNALAARNWNRKNT